MTAKRKSKKVEKSAEATDGQTPAPTAPSAGGKPAVAPSALEAPEPAKKPDDAVPAEYAPPPGPLVAGIVASAGGLEAFKGFFTAMPDKSGIAFVLVPHLDPQHESLMVELLARHTSMPVVEVTEAMPVEPDHVYIIPPNKYMTISGGMLRLTGPVERGGPQTSIDLFLRSLADDKGEKAVCIVLSGTGSHGTMGLKAIKAAGGMAMVQESTTADYPAMPQSAIATGLADFILPVAKMPQALLRYNEHRSINGGEAAAEGPQATDELSQVLTLLRRSTKLDFRLYRKKMLARRIHRRMGLKQFEQLPDYLRFLKENPEEVQHLARDLLINVTSFFRDPEAWRALETDVIAPLIRAKEPDAPIRVWSVGCATGEEAYSVGIVLLEQLAEAQKPCPVQIFATDVDADAIEVAREGNYPESIAADVARQRLARFFTRVSDSSYQVSRQLREIVTFARQNVLSDAPFSKIDFVLCRNLVIYLELEAQKKVLSHLHFCLNEGGSLFLGPSETIGRNLDLFDPISAKWRIYRRIGPRRLAEWDFPVMQMEPLQVKPRPTAQPGPPLRLAELAQNFLLRRLTVACVVINRNYEVLHFAGPTEDYLTQPGGPPTQDLLSLARPGLESKLRVVIQRAIRENGPQSVNNVMMRQAGGTLRVNIDVEPLNLSKQTEGLLLVSFQQQRPQVGETPTKRKKQKRTEESALVRQLEQELDFTREDLQGTIEELESSNEELKASNEEIMSMNEELQSTNEELETSKEESQSLNEELNTVNNQLNEKIGDLEAANNDMANLLNCTDVATIFLDRNFRIRRFTPEATKLFSLIPADVGRPLDDIARKLNDPELFRDAESVLHELSPRVKEAQSPEGRWWIRRIIPYRTLDNRIDGVVITFGETTQLKEADLQTLREQKSRLEAIVNTAADAIITIDHRGIIESVNAATERMFGYTASEMVGQRVNMLMPSPYREEHDAFIARYLKTGEKHIIGISREIEAQRKDGSIFPTELAVSEIAHLKLFTGIHRDLTSRKQLERDIVEIASQEQRRIGQDLHDSVAQELAALSLLAKSVAETLQTDPANASKLVGRMEQGLQRSRQGLRAVLRGLLPVSVDSEGLMAALADLVSRGQQEGQVTCTFECPAPVVLDDNTAATQLFLIAQEAFHNALKHGQPRNVRISLHSNRVVVLRVQCDGIGMPSGSEMTGGMGLRIMRNRAAIIGAKLTIEPAKPTGTVVTCTLATKNDEPK